MTVQGIRYIVTWVSEPTACARCLALNGKEWTVDDLGAVPLIQEMFSHPNCKCEIDIQIDVDPTELEIW
ncbi:phage head morphogenesis protein [Candidatus Bathyarchaeota archaeon]|nr:phage head morphogenesis protein [Candidatus Bathyarchaeota archaeon]